MATLSKITPGGTAAELTLVAAASGGDKFENTNGKAYLVIKNGHGADSRTITVHAAKVCNFGVEHDLVITIPFGETWTSKMLPKTLFADETGFTNITYSDSAADITIACVQM